MIQLTAKQRDIMASALAELDSGIAELATESTSTETRALVLVATGVSIIGRVIVGTMPVAALADDDTAEIPAVTTEQTS